MSHLRKGKEGGKREEEHASKQGRQQTDAEGGSYTPSRLFQVHVNVSVNVKDICSNT